MEIYKGPWTGISQLVPSAVTIGTFDGVHLGHRKILDRLKSIASARSLISAVVTFDPHPQEVFRDKKPDIRILTDIAEKTAIMKDLGIELLAIIDFTRELAELSPREFVEEVIVKRLKASHVVIGYDHAFGKNRAGTQDNLRTLASDFGYQVTTIEPVEYNGVVISSTKIRQALYRTEIEKGNAYLGRRYAISGTVVQGDRRGRLLNMPTANVAPSHSKKLVPGDAVYSGIARTGADTYQAAISIGTRPTFESGNRVLEAHLIGFDGDLYDKPITLEFDSKIRDQIAFKTSEELVSQMNSDIEVVRKMNIVQRQTV